MAIITKLGAYITEDPLHNPLFEMRQEFRASLFRCEPANEELNSIANWGFFEGAVFGAVVASR